uniref:Uncharacterized protein n=1 Tax=Phlebotomus papatasi TaxID=29031 RepID=A0A1B0DL70_PHLPP
MFRGCKTEDMPPHVYSLAQTAYRTMLETRRDQSLIFMGRSGSGKTTSFKHALYYLALAADKKKTPWMRSNAKVTKIEGDDGPWTTTNGESVWLVHRGGFCAATRFLQKNPGESNGKVLIELQHSGEQLHVDEDDIEKANPSKLDLVEDICQLKHLNEASVLHCLRQRYASNLIHTKAGPTLMVVNPMAPLSLYSEKVCIEVSIFFL